MPLAPGTRLGPYEVVSPIGEGGMGEVYRAKDTRLDRDVAIKVLPGGVAADPERLARFEGEAKAVASLSHPNILAIHDFGHEGPVAFAVMELLRGATLRERLLAGAMPLRKAVEAAVQIARGLAAAHDRGFVHRDLKPENIFLLDDGQVKILDFGLAKADAAGRPGAEAQTFVATDPGTVLGTVGYMAPEQVRGQAVDARADLFAFGAVFYEMLTGLRAFQRETAAETLTAILKEDPPDLTAARADLPPSLDRIVRHCLEKHPTERFQTARDVAFALEALSGSGSGSSRIQAAASQTGATRRRVPVAWLAAVGMAAAVAAGGLVWWLRPAPSPIVRKLDLAVDTLLAGIHRIPVISPDGRRLVYARGDGLWVRPLDGLDAIRVGETEGAVYFSWSPDSRSLAYVRNDKLWRVGIDGGKPVALGPVPPDLGGSGGTCWLTDGRILLIGSDRTGMIAISDRGGDASAVIEIDKETEVDFHEMSPLPGNGVLFTVHHVATQRADSIDALVDGRRKVVMSFKTGNVRQPFYSPTGHLVYVRESINPGIWAVRFSLKTLEASGEPFLVAPGSFWPTLAGDGTLAMVRPSDIPPDLVWISQAGVVRIASLQHTLGFSGDNRLFSLSPDGTRALLALQTESYTDLWMMDLANGALTQLTRDAGQVLFPLWMPDGWHALVTGRFDGRLWNLHRIDLRTLRADRLTTSPEYDLPESTTRDGRTIVYADTANGGRIWTLALDAGGKPGTPVRLSQTQAWETSPRLSPDDRYLAYLSNPNGRAEVFVRPFPSGGTPQLVSQGSESAVVLSPVWSRDGREILYRSGDRIMSVKVAQDQSGLVLGPPTPVATVPSADGFSLPFDVAADGRLLLTKATGRDHISVVLNWTEDLRRIEASGVGR